MEIVIRLAELQDYDRLSNIMDQVQELHAELRPDVYKMIKPLITKEMYEDILKGNNWYVAEVDGVVVGVLELAVHHIKNPALLTKDILFISTIAVDEKWRGMGIGHKLLEKAKQIKEENGFDSIELQVSAQNIKAYEMYKNYGFEEKSILMELK